MADPTAAAEAIADKITKRAILGQRYDASLSADIIAQVTDLERDLVGQIAAIDVTSVTKPSARLVRLQKLLSQSREQIKAAYRRIRLLNDRELSKLLEIEAEATAKLVDAGFQKTDINISVSLPTDAVFAALAEEHIIIGQPLKEWWAKQEAGAFSEFSRQIRLGVGAGETVDQLARRIAGGTRDGIPIQGVMEVSRKTAKTLVRTSVASVQNTARQAVYEANSDIFTELVQLSKLDGRTSEICIARAGKAWDMQTKEPIGHSLPFQTPPIHPNCLPGDSLVSPGGRIAGASKRWMDGEVVVICTAAGREFTATPNHPVLTDGGWRPAGLVKEGDKVICVGRTQWSHLGIRYDKNIEAPIHEFAEAALGSFEMSAVPVPLTAPHFHGDGADSEVAIVAVDWRLLLEGNAALSEQSGERYLGGADIEHSLLDTECGFNSLAVTNAPPSRCGMGGAQHRGARRIVGSAPALDHLSADAITSFGAGPANGGGILTGADNTALAQQSIDGTWADAECLREFARTDSGEIETDDVVRVSRRPFSGHVYNLETESGWYSANGLITHNCRSVLVTTVLGGNPPVDMTGEQWVKKLPAAEQDSILGKGKAELYRAGKITVRDLIDQTNRPVSLQALRDGT